MRPVVIAGFLAVIGLLCSLLAPPASQAQSRHPEDSLRLPCAAQPNAKTVDLTQRRDYRLCQYAGSLAEPEASARALLSHFATRLGMQSDLGDLAVVELRETGVSAHTRFEQQYDGTPIFGAWVKVNQGANGGVTSLHTTYRVAASGGSGQPSISRNRSRQLAMDAAGVQEIRLPERHRKVWFPVAKSELRIAREFWIYSADPLGDFLTVVDGDTGKILFQENRIAFDTGTAKIFWPNPVQFLGDTTLQDNGDANSPTLEGARIEVTLERLDSGTGQLKGVWADVTLPGGIGDSCMVDEPSRVYDYTRDQCGFEQALTYYTLDQIGLYMHSLGFDDDVGSQNGIRDFPSKANAHWDDADNSFYSTGDDAIHMGRGGVDDAEDPDVVTHEQGHAIHHDQNSCWGGGEMGAMGEGFGDYLAFTIQLGLGDATYQSNNAACVAEWDATSYSSTDPPCLRRVDTDNHYPEDLIGQVHHDGLIWGGLLRDIHLVVGREATDQIILQSHFAVPCNATMSDAADALLQADVDLNGGANASAIRQAVCDRGIFTGEDCAPASGVSLAVSANPSPASTGATVTYTATVQNTGETAFSDLTLSAAVPVGSSYVAASASDSGAETGGVVQWPTFDLSVGASTQRTFQVQVTMSGGSGVAFEDDMEAGSGKWETAHGTGSADWTLSEDNPFGGQGSSGKVPTEVVAATACVSGSANVFSCNKVSLGQFLPLSALGASGEDGNDGWGWTDSTTGREYYIAGRQGGVSFVDVTNPQSPIFLGTLATHTSSSDWRDIKVIGDNAYIVSEAPGHGMQVFDLTQLRNVNSPPQVFSATAHYSGFGNAHNIVANADTNFVYAVGTGYCSGGLHMVDVSDPASPAFAGCFSSDGYTHDAQCVVYDGPDSTYAGREICFAFNEDTLTIVDVTDKNSPVQISRTGYAGVAYTHQGWLTEDQVYILLNDELDEQNSGHKTRTYIVDVTDLDAPAFTSSYTGALPSIDHNNYTKGDFVYQANYTSGLRILKTTDIASGTLCEVASFDVYPDSDNAVFAGAWNVFVDFASGTIAVNSIEGIFFLSADLSDPQCVGPGEGSGTSWFASEPGALSDQYLTTADSFTVQSGAELRFWGSYGFEQDYDGGVVEISTDGGSSWVDLGPKFTQNGYTGTISANYGSAIGGREAFSGSSDGYKQSVVDLSSYAGESVKIRFRAASDNSVSGDGWHIDEVLVGEESRLTLVASVTPAGGSATEVTVSTDVMASACGNGVIDGGEVCDPGISGSTCCTNQCVLATAATSCRSAVSVCDIEEQCNGSDPTCPADVFAGAGGVCRAADGACDQPETCTGTSATCPTDGFLDAGVECRASETGCDKAETCTGSGASCPADGFAESGVECRPKVGVCDVAESCTGTSKVCPSNGFAGSGVECREKNGVCDIPEACTGSSPACGADLVAGAEVICRLQVGVCDVSENCSGASVFCGEDESVADGTTCSDGQVCTQGDVCTGGVCGGTCGISNSCGLCGGTCSDASGTCLCVPD